ncbi:MAG: addiction module toxin RelE [Defluviitaleaceae bacterium]|nr:addiction module toxin RelE [Defluviitaleaceae bacterium]
MEKINVKPKKQPVKFLQAVDNKAFKKLDKALKGLEKWEGDIKKLAGSSKYRLKKPPYRLIFEYDKEANTIYVLEINLRGNIDYGRYV